MFRLSLHIGPLHLDVAIGDTPEVVEEGTPLHEYPPVYDITPCTFSFEGYAEEYADEWDE